MIINVETIKQKQKIEKSVQYKIFIFLKEQKFDYKYNLINSSLTADGVRMPMSVKRRVMYAGGV